MFDTRILYPQKKFPRKTCQHCRHRFSLRRQGSSDAIVEWCYLISRCHNTMKPASASAWLAGTGARRARRTPPEGGGGSRTGRIVRNRVRSYRRRGCHPTYRPRPPPRPSPPSTRTPPRRGGSSGGGVSARLRPVRATYVPLRSLVRRERIFEVCIRGSRARFRDGLRYEPQRSFLDQARKMDFAYRVLEEKKNRKRSRLKLTDIRL